MASREVSKAENKSIRGYEFRAWPITEHSDVLPEHAVGSGIPPSGRNEQVPRFKMDGTIQKKQLDTGPELPHTKSRLRSAGSSARQILIFLRRALPSAGVLRPELSNDFIRKRHFDCGATEDPQLPRLVLLKNHYCSMFFSVHKKISNSSDESDHLAKCGLDI